MTTCDGARAELVAFDRGELADAVATAVRDHVAACASCAAELRRLRRAARLVARATEIAPRADASARLVAAVDAALAPADTLAAPRPASGLWERARLRYEQSAGFRRFTLTSIAVHAAAAVVLAVLLARGGASGDRSATVHYRPDETPFELRDGAGASDLAANLPAYDAASPDGVAVPGAPGTVFPNRATAARWGASATAETRHAALRVALGDDGAASAEFTLDRGLAWLAAQRRTDGSMPAGARPTEAFEATAASVYAFAAQGRTSADDAGLGASVAWLERRADAADIAEDFAARGLALRALTAQLVADFGRLDRKERLRRAGAVAAIAGKLETDVTADGAHGPENRGAHAAATVSAAAALADVRTAGFRDTSKGLAALARRLESSRAADGRLVGPSQDAGVSLTAALAEIAADIGARPLSDTAVTSLRARIGGLASVSALDAARGAGALAALGRPVREPVAAALATQLANGGWPATAGAPVADVAATAYGVLAVTRAYRR